MRLILLIFIISFSASVDSEIHAQARLSSLTKISGVEHSTVKRLRKPSFPTGCRCKFAKNESTLVESRIDSYGNVYKAIAVSGHPVLRAAAEAAARRSEFTSNRISNVLTGAKILIRYQFIRNAKINIGAKVIKVETDPSWMEACSDCTPARRTPVSMPPPKFPAAGTFLGLAGTVEVEIIVTEDGKVESARAISGHPLLRKSAEDAARLAEFSHWTPTPGKTRHILVVPYRFIR